MHHNQHVQSVIDAFHRYFEGRIGIATLQRRVALAESLVEGDVPRPVRDAITTAENQLDERNVVRSATEVAQVRQIFDDFMAVVEAYR